MKKIKLFCIPYAGGSADVYTRWKKFLDEYIELCPVELAGRGRRSKVSYYIDMDEAVRDVIQSIKDQVEEDTYAIFGHSMGSIIAYEVSKQAGKYGLADPVHAFFSGRYPPGLYRPREVLHDLPDEVFKQKMLQFGGIPKSLTTHSGLLNVILNTLRADLKIVEKYVCTHGNEVLDFDISIFRGTDDSLAEEADMEVWREYTKRNCRIYSFEGGHFFIHNHIEAITEVINRTLLETCLHSTKPLMIGGEKNE